MKKAITRLSSAIAGLDSVEDVQAFLEDALTPGELRDLALRWQLMELLAEGMPQREIARRLGISLCKITRGVKYLKACDRPLARSILTASEKKTRKSE